jgi:hypothetical protein
MTSEKFTFKYKHNPILTSFMTSLTGLECVGKYSGIRFLSSWLCIYMKRAKLLGYKQNIIVLYYAYFFINIAVECDYDYMIILQSKNDFFEH